MLLSLLNVTGMEHEAGVGTLGVIWEILLFSSTWNWSAYYCWKKINRHMDILARQLSSLNRQLWGQELLRLCGAWFSEQGGVLHVDWHSLISIWAQSLLCVCYLVLFWIVAVALNLDKLAGNALGKTWPLNVPLEDPLLPRGCFLLVPMASEEQEELPAYPIPFLSTPLVLQSQKYV